MGILKTGKDLKRLNDLLSILLKYGFGDLIRRMGLTQSMENAGKLIRYQISGDLLSLEPPERARRAIEEMGPTYIKLGQVLATRVDLFGPEWIKEFEKLQDDAPIIPFEQLREQLALSLGQDPDNIFREINPMPLGSASLGQVHHALTHKGRDVVLKIRKPGTREKIESDLRLMHHVARIAAVQSQEVRRYHPEEIVKEFERSLHRELDFSIEARNSERIAKNLKSIPYVKIPKIYWEWTCEDLNVQEYIDGIPAKDIAAIEAAGLDRKAIARRGAKIVWKTMMEDGFFHADPHPGNFYILPKNKIVMIDFGMVGKLNRKRREQLIQLIRHIVFQDVEKLAAVLLEWTGGKFVNFDILVSECADMMEAYYGLPLNEVDLAKVLQDIGALLHNHDITLPPELTLFAKALITLEGFGRLINPEFDLMSEAEPLIRQMIKERYNPRHLVKKWSGQALELVDRLYQEPLEAASLKTSTQIQPLIEPQVIEKLSNQMDDFHFRQTQSILHIGYLIVFTLLMIGNTGPEFYSLRVINVIGLVGFLGVTLSVTRFQLVMWWQRKNRNL